MGVRSAAELIREVEHSESEGIRIFKNVTPAIFELFDKRIHSLRKIRITYFDAEQTLFVKMPGPEHEVAIRHLVNYFQARINEAGLGKQVEPVGASRLLSSSFPYKSEKECDDGFLVQHLIGNDVEIPTVTFEIAASQTRNAGRQAVRWGFGNTKPGDEYGWVTTGILMSIAYNTKRDVIGFVIEQWHREKTEPSSTTTVLLKDLKEPVGRLPNPSLWNVSGSIPLRISFEDLFLRSPQTANEQDLLVTADELVDVATHIIEARRRSQVNVSNFSMLVLIT